MSLYSALFAGVSALTAQSQALGILADNVANVNTVGYKETRAAFKTLVTQARTETNYSPGGVSSIPTALIDRQGILQSSSFQTDIAISGDGFFVGNTISAPSSTDGTYVYTRAGQFRADQDGNLKNAAGYYLQGWPIDATGALPTDRSSLDALETVNINNLTGSAQATTEIGLSANLQSSTTITAGYTVGDLAAEAVTTGGGTVPDFERSVQIFDSQGGTHTLTFGFLKTGINTWSTELYIEPSTDVTSTDGLVASGDITFNTDGSLATVPAGLSTVNITTWAAALGIADSDLAIDFGTIGANDGLTQFDGASTLVGNDINGAIFGSLSGVEFSETGVVTALFDNGTSQEIYKVPIATFPNVNGLTNKTGNAWVQSASSGDFNLNEAGIGASGLVQSAALEASTVDIGNEFTTMITTQRAYSAGARIITTADDMLEELIRIKR